MMGKGSTRDRLRAPCGISGICGGMACVCAKSRRSPARPCRKGRLSRPDPASPALSLMLQYKGSGRIISPDLTAFCGAVMNSVDSFLANVIDGDGLVKTDWLSNELHITKTELASASGLSRDSVSKATRLRARA